MTALSGTLVLGPDRDTTAVEPCLLERGAESIGGTGDSSRHMRQTIA